MIAALFAILVITITIQQLPATALPTVIKNPAALAAKTAMLKAKPTAVIVAKNFLVVKAIPAYLNAIAVFIR